MPGIWHIVHRPTKLLLSYGAVDGTVLWRDDLSVGPVPSGIHFEELCAFRNYFWTTMSKRRTPSPSPEEAALFNRTRRPFPWILEQDSLPILKNAQGIILWFGPGLSSQLAMLQCVDLIPDSVAVYLVSLTYPDWNQDATDIAWQKRKLLDSEHRSFARELWSQFRDTSPLRFHESVASAPDVFRDLASAAQQLRLSFPSLSNGLDNLQSVFLEAVREADCALAECMARALSRTDHGDGPLFGMILDLLQAKSPLIEIVGEPLNVQNTQRILGQRLRLTATGQAVLSAELDAVEVHGVDRWIGGCHINSETGTGFRWDAASQSFFPLDCKRG